MDRKPVREMTLANFNNVKNSMTSALLKDSILKAKSRSRERPTAESRIRDLEHTIREQAEENTKLKASLSKKSAKIT